MRVPLETMIGEFERVLRKYGMDEERAALSARLFAEASRDGVYTHGLNRFPKFIKSVEAGCVDMAAVPVLKERFGMLERWDGCGGPGNLNAWECTKRAIEMARENTMGCVALSHTNHWMRPGAFGLLAAEHDCIGIFWTNTVPNMPAWGGREAKLGNNPLVVSIPNGECPVLLDVAMSLYSYGKLEAYVHSERELPYEGGFDREGNLTRDPSAILETHQTLPIGMWKGAGLSLVLDLIAAALSGGRSSREVGELPLETELSQMFMAIHLGRLPDRDRIGAMIGATLRDIKESTPVKGGGDVRYPGEGMVRTRKESMEKGVLVEPAIWEQVLAY